MEPRIWHRYYDEGVTSTMEIPAITIYDVLTHAQERCPGNPATYFMGHVMTYARLKDHVDRMAAGLAAMGVKKGAREIMKQGERPEASPGAESGYS